MAAAKRRKSTKAAEAPHRGRIQAQGAGVEKSVSWNRQTPPSESEMMAMVQQLEAKLTPSELRARERAFIDLREYIRRAVMKDGTGIIRSKRFPFDAVGGIRLDLEVLKGTAAVADKKSSH
jgi:hypothetical protein